VSIRNVRLFLTVATPALALASASGAAFGQEAAAPQSIASADAEPVDGEIVVSTFRASLETAQAIKEDSDQIVDSVVAEDIGKLPDVTAAESLARVTGVQVDWAQGGASGVRVRGLPDLTTTYNGREIFTAEGRSVALQDFPSSSIARIDVYKSASANLIEPGIAGLIDVRSRKPLDFKGDRIAGGISGLHWYQSQKIGLDANLLVSKRWNTGIGDIGFLIEGSYADVNFLDSARNVSQTILNRNVAGVGVIRYPSFVNIDYPTANRFRPSVASALQWRPSDRLEFYADFLFQGFRGKGSGRNLQINSGDAAVLSDIEFFPGTNLVKSMTATAGGIPTGAQNVIDAKTDTYQGGGGFIWKSDRLRVSGDIALTDSTYTQYSFGMNYALRTQPTRHFDFDTDAGDGGGTVTVSGFDLFDPANYRMSGLNENGVRNHGRDVQARLDLDYKLDALGISNIQAGLRFNTRDAESYNYTRSATAPAGLFYTQLPLEYARVSPGFRGDDADSIRTFLTPTRGSILENMDTLRGLVGWAPGRPEFGDPVYHGNEKAYAGYVQARYEFDVAGMPVDGLVGLRAVRTEDTIHGFTRATANGVTTVTAVTRENSYEDFLPNVSARLRILPQLQLRLAYTHTRSRPAFGQLNPSLTVGAPSTVCNTDPTSPDCVRTASGGNPDLKPIDSKNYDASLEWYFNRSGSLTVGAFQRDVEGFISNFTVDVDDAEFGRLRITQPFNGGKGRIRGIEAGFRTFLRFPFLPDWTQDFGFLANYTYIDHASELPDDLAATLPGMQKIAGVSSHLANLAAFYEKPEFSVRLSYNYRSSYVVSYGRVNDPALGAGVLGPTLPVVEDGRGIVDFSGTVNPTESITLSFTASNLLGAAATNHRQFNAQGQTYPWQTRFLERVYRLGVRFRF
jgi:TonB-dependent receptor